MFDPGPEAGPLRAVCRGRDEVKSFFERLSRIVVKFEAEPRRFLEAGDDVFVLVQMYGKFSRGVEAWIPVIHQWTLQERRIVGWKSFPSSGKPLEAELVEVASFDQAQPRAATTGTTASSRRVGTAQPPE